MQTAKEGGSKAEEEVMEEAMPAVFWLDLTAEMWRVGLMTTRLETGDPARGC